MYKIYLDRFLTWLTPLKKEPPGLLEAVNSARRDWKQAQYDINFVSDSNLIDYTIHKIKAGERQYMALLQEARQQSITAWQEEPQCPSATCEAPQTSKEGPQTREKMMGPSL
ncbi:DUF2508 family protein [Desulfoscipio gibsoniae]|uniref:DUF2508 family protein n=1 Tax=Desulfoscipio gibsoniae TaxID=102134 RepID=UPI0002FFCD81|nr:DUF2508 family protein [Desulfoscipio gibsoniae]